MPVHTRPRRRHHTRRPRHALAAVLLPTALLIGCAPAPDPDPALVALLEEARTDSQALAAAAPEVAELRAGHAGELDAEIQRVCGLTDEGTPPESCVLALPEIAAAPTDDAPGRILSSQEFILDHLDQIPGDSVGLLTTQYIEQARFQPRPAEDAPEVPAELALSAAELDTARELLDREYAAAWGLGTALAYLDTDADPSAGTTVTAAIEGHRARADLLLRITATGETPAPEPAAGYTSDLPELTDHSSALTLITTVQDNARESWHAAAAAADDPQWRILATRVAGDTARDTTGLD